MRSLYLIKLIINSMLLIATGTFSAAQCPAGYATANLNWDNLDYLNRTGAYTAFVTTPMMYTQRFAIGTNKLAINFPTTMTTVGENTTHTLGGETGSFGTGADVEYSGNGAITIDFNAVVYNLQFSLYDIDVNQNVRVTAIDGASVPVAVNLTTAAAGVLTIAGSGGLTPTATANATACTNTENRGTVNVSILGSSPAGVAGVKRVIITVGGTAGNFWLSDMRACVNGSFPLNYYVSEQPWIGQPSYYLVTPDNNSVYLMDPVTGNCKWLFSEPASPWLNSLAYDGAKKVIYYVMDNPTPVSTNRSLKKYDMNTKLSSTVIADLSTLGIPMYELVVESAGAAFYNGSLYLGIEGTNRPAYNSNRESIIWRIDFDAAGTPIQASQVLGRPADNGTGTLTHDWGDFTIKDGILYDFNTGNVGATSQYLHYNMQTGAETIFPPLGGSSPIQAGQTWDGRIYWTGGQGTETGRVALYDGAGGIGTKVVAKVIGCGPLWAGRAGDASDPIRPRSDFGDAPASYDPVFMDKATHEYDCNLRLGATFDDEWDKTPSAAVSDGNDEDGISTVTVLTSGVANYVQDVTVFNNKGVPATVAAWLDFNNNGTFDAVEGKIFTVPSSAVSQTITLSWIGIPVALLPGENTYLRVRITTATGMTVSTPTKWFDNGEVEDYIVPVDVTLPVKLLSFTAETEGEKVALKWISSNEINFSGYDIERSSNGTDWKNIGFVPGFSDNSPSNNYLYFDHTPLTGKSYYRLKLVSNDGTFEYSDIRRVDIRSMTTWMKLSPNPANTKSTLEYSLDKAEHVTIRVTSASGIQLLNVPVASVKGINQFNLNDLNRYGTGVYIVQVITADDVLSSKLVINK